MLTANWSINRHVRGTKDWAIMQWLWAAGLLLYIPRNIWSDWLCIVLSNMLIVIGSFFLLRGFCKFQGIKSTPLFVELIGIGLMLFGYYYLTFVYVDLHIRVIMLSVFSFMIMFRAFIVLWPIIQNKGGVSWVVGAGIFVHGLFFLSRAVLTVSSDPSEDLLAGGAGAVWMLTEAILFVFWSTISFALLTNFRLQEDLKLLADRDPLTNLLNRRAIFELCEKKILGGEIAYASVLVLDLDKFKLINDNFGHPVGDKVLQHFAKLTEKLLPEKALFGRTGGEEFIIVLPDMRLGLAEDVAEKICERTRSALIIVNEHNIQFTVSVGIANGKLELATDLREIINDADKAMYLAKNKGRDRYHKVVGSLATN